MSQYLSGTRKTWIKGGGTGKRLKRENNPGNKQEGTGVGSAARCVVYGEYSVWLDMH